MQTSLERQIVGAFIERIADIRAPQINQCLRSAAMESRFSKRELEALKSNIRRAQMLDAQQGSEAESVLKMLDKLQNQNAYDLFLQALQVRFKPDKSPQRSSNDTQQQIINSILGKRPQWRQKSGTTVSHDQASTKEARTLQSRAHTANFQADKVLFSRMVNARKKVAARAPQRRVEEPKKLPPRDLDKCEGTKKEVAACQGQFGQAPQVPSDSSQQEQEFDALVEQAYSIIDESMSNQPTEQTTDCGDDEDLSIGFLLDQSENSDCNKIEVEQPAQGSYSRSLTDEEQQELDKQAIIEQLEQLQQPQPGGAQAEVPHKSLVQLDESTPKKVNILPFVQKYNNDIFTDMKDLRSSVNVRSMISNESIAEDQQAFTTQDKTLLSLDQLYQQRENVALHNQPLQQGLERPFERLREFEKVNMSIIDISQSRLCAGSQHSQAKYSTEGLVREDTLISLRTRLLYTKQQLLQRKRDVDAARATKQKAIVDLRYQVRQDMEKARSRYFEQLQPLISRASVVGVKLRLFQHIQRMKVRKYVQDVERRLQIEQRREHIGQQLAEAIHAQ